jgi:hypothetical protein
MTFSDTLRFSILSMDSYAGGQAISYCCRGRLSNRGLFFACYMDADTTVWVSLLAACAIKIRESVIV